MLEITSSIYKSLKFSKLKWSTSIVKYLFYLENLKYKWTLFYLLRAVALMRFYDISLIFNISISLSGLISAFGYCIDKQKLLFLLTKKIVIPQLFESYYLFEDRFLKSFVLLWYVFMMIH